MTIADSKPAYFAVASAPGPSPMEFLVKAVPDTTSAMLGDLKEGKNFSGQGTAHICAEVES